MRLRLRKEVQPRQHQQALGSLQEGLPEEAERVQCPRSKDRCKRAEEVDKARGDDRQEVGVEEGERKDTQVEGRVTSIAGWSQAG